MNGYDYARLRRIEQKADEIVARNEQRNAHKAEREAERAEQRQADEEHAAELEAVPDVPDLAGGLDPYAINEGGYFDAVAEARKARRPIYYR